jgi:hypothetical protein
MSTIENIIQLISGEPALELPDILSQDDWEETAVTAIVLGLAPLLHWRLDQTLVDQLKVALPPMVMAKLAVTRQAHARRNEAIARQLAEILAACAQRRLKTLVLKGALLAPLAYPEAALRPMNDIDLLFQPEDLPEVGRLLERLGYHGKYKDASQGPGITKHLNTYRRTGNDGATPNPYLSAAGDRTIEPHGSLEESWFGLKVDITPGGWDRAVPISLHDQPAYRLSANDMLLHLSVHAAFHVIMGASVFVQLYDIKRVADTWSGELDWSQILALSRRARAQAFVYAGLYWARTLYQAAIPAATLQALKAECPSNLISYVHTLDASGLFKRTQRPPLVTLKQRLWRGILDRREAARWAGSLGEKWRIWQTALAVHKTDTASLLLGKTLKAEV